MNSRINPYKRHRYPAEIIQYAVWLYYRFNLSHRDIEDLLAERGIVVSYESIRCWCNKFGPKGIDKLTSTRGVALRNGYCSTIISASRFHLESAFMPKDGTDRLIRFGRQSFDDKKRAII